MATAYDDLINQIYQQEFGRAADVSGAEYWANQLAGGLTEQDFANLIASSQEGLINQIYQEQAGRFADIGGSNYWQQQLASGSTIADITKAINQSKEGQDFDTQKITSLYRQNLGRNPEQEGFQYWLSEAQKLGYTPAELENVLKSAAVTEQINRGIDPGTAFTNVQVADLEADPYGGRYATQSMYDLLPNPVNVSMIGDRQVQFVTPAGQRSVVSNYSTGGSAGFNANAGMDVINTPALQAAIQRALDSGAMTPQEYRTMFADIDEARKSGSIDDFYAALNKPQAQVVIDALYGQQTGEANTLDAARAEASQRQAVLDANNLGFYQANPQLAAQYEAAGLYYPFGADAYSGYDTRTDQSNVVTDENFNQQLSGALRTLYGQFGGAQDMVTPLTGQYYSEAGLQPGYTAPAAGQNTFRSGVAGYTPNLPTMFQFGQAPVDASFQQYRPGAFQPSGVTTGGFITGYNADGTPIYSTYSDPGVSVGGAVAPTTVAQVAAANPVNSYFAAPNGQIYASPEAYYATVNASAGG